MTGTVDHDHASAQLTADLYARQSRGNAASIDDQIAAGEVVCEQNAWSIRLRRRDAVSASRFGSKERDEWAALVADVEARRMDIVILWEASRGDRKPAEWARFLEVCRQSGVRIYAIRDRHLYDLGVARDWKTLHSAGVDAGYESEVRSADTRRGTASAAAAGKPHGKVGFGYRRVYDSANRKKFHDEPDEFAPIAAEIITRVSKREPITAIADDLTERQAGGRSWSRKAIKLLAVNPRYIGQRSHHGQLHPAAWPGIVAEDVFWRAVTVLGEDDRKRSAPGSMRYLLSYSMVCGAEGCGAHINVNPALARPRYKCLHGCLSIDQWAADEWVTWQLLDRLAQPDARVVFARGGDDLQEAEAEVARLTRQLDEAREAFADDVISPAALGVKEKRLAPLLDAAQKRVREARNADAVLDLLGEGEFTVDVGRPRWAAMPVAARRTVVKTVFTSITLQPTDKRLSAHCTDVDRLEMAAERISWAWR
jgi:site-specific DNA recombinase